MGVPVPVGVYMEGAYIKNGTITTAKIGDAQIDDAKIAALSASKLTIGDGTVGGNLKSADYIPGSQGWLIPRTGDAELSNVTVRGTVYATAGTFTGTIEAIGAGGAGGDKARMHYGNFEVYRTVPGVGQVLYKALSRSESGVGDNNVSVTIPGYFRSQPRVIVSPASLQLYAAAYSGQNQSITVEARSITESSPGSMTWSFSPVATLNLAANTGLSVVNQSSGTTSGAWISSQYTTPANATSISPSVMLASNRGNGASQYFYRTVRWKVQYYNGSSWVDGAYTTANLAADTGASTVSTATFMFPSSGTWTFRIYCEAYDTSTALFGAAAYAYVTDTFSRSDRAGLETSLGPLTLTYAAAYAIPAGWERYGDYSLTAQVNYRLGNPADAYARIDNDWLPTTSSGWVTVSKRYNRSSASLFIQVGSGGSGAISSCYINSMTGSVQRRQLAANSSTAQNSFQLNSYGYMLASAQVLATGSLNWVAIGD